MKNINILPLKTKQKLQIVDLARIRKNSDHICIDIVSFKDNRLTIRAEQKDLLKGKELNKKELIAIARKVFKGIIPKEWELTVVAISFSRKEINNLSAEWIRSKMELFGLKNRTLVIHTDIEDSTISLLINGERELTKWHKVAFYYFFKYYEMASTAKE